MMLTRGGHANATALDTADLVPPDEPFTTLAALRERGCG